LALANGLFKNILSNEVLSQTGLTLKGGSGASLQQCIDGPSQGNETVLQCPVSLKNNQDKQEFLVLVFNPASVKQESGQSSFAKVKLPNRNFKA
jgi:hypothetical protein